MQIWLPIARIGWMSERVSVGCFMLYQHLGSFSWQKQVQTYSVLGDHIYEMGCLILAVGTQCPLYSAASLG